jgi:glucan biosynthesis protein C
MTIYLFHMIVAMLVILAMAHLGGATGPSPRCSGWACARWCWPFGGVFLVVRRVPVLAVVFGGQRVRPARVQQG